MIGYFFPFNELIPPFQALPPAPGLGSGEDFGRWQNKGERLYQSKALPRACPEAKPPGTNSLGGNRRGWIGQIVLGWVWLMLWSAGCLATEEKLSLEASSPSSTKNTPPELRFIRVYAPADRVSQWPWGPMKYVPVDGEEFERLIRVGTESDFGAPVQAKISRLTCRASVSAGMLLEGECTMAVHVPVGQSALLRLPKWPLAIRTAVWVDREGKPQEPASLGMNEYTQTELLVPRSGQVRLHWSLQGQQDTGGLRFDLRWPACPHTELLLDLPEGYQPVLPGALIRAQEPRSAPGRKVWLLEWGGPIAGPLRLVEQQGASWSARMLLQQESQYTLGPEGLDASVRFTIQALGEPVSELSFLVEGGLEPRAVQLAGESLRWRWETMAGLSARRLWVLLPEPIHKEAQSLQLMMVGPVVLDAPWQLPRIRLEGAIWQQGSLALRIATGLQVQRIGCSNCRQSKAEQLAPETGRGGESFEFQAYSPDAAVEMILARTEPLAQVETGSWVMFTERLIQARVRARVHTQAGEHFVLQAQVARRWLIDAVEADPATQVEDWTLEPASQRLTIRLSRPVTAQRPVSLQITARRLQSPVGRSWRTEDLLPLRFTGVQEGKHLVALSPPDAAYELICLTPEPNELVPPRQLEAGDWDLVDKRSEGFFFFVTPQSQSFQWLLRPRLPQYRATIQMDVAASSKSVLERYRIECIPEGSRLERIVIVFSHSRPEPLQWRLSGDPQRQCTARRLRDKELPTDQIPPGGEAWEIQLRPSRSEAFVLLAQRTTALGGEMPLALAALPQAVQQEATIRLQTLGPDSPQILPSRIQPIPSPREALLPGWTTQLAAFRYDPKQELSGAQGPALVLRPLQAPAASRQTWAWQARLESWYQPDGLSKHIATYWFVNFHRDQLNVQFPSDAPSPWIEGVWLNQQPARWQVRNLPQKEGSDFEVEVDISTDRTFSTLVIAFHTRQPPLRSGKHLLPWLPRLDVPVLSRSWALWLPPGWQIRCPTEDALQPPKPELSLRERLFGILARPRHRQPFDPFLPQHWKSLGQQDVVLQRQRQQAEAFLQALGALLRRAPPSQASPESARSGSSPNRPWTWAELLQQEAVGHVGKILLDRQGLWEAGIEPNSPVWVCSLPASSGDSPGQPEAYLARQALWQARLALALYQGILLITSFERASGWGSWAENLGDPLLWRIAPEVGDRLLHGGSLSEEALLVSPDIWQDCAQASPAGVFRPVEWAFAPGGLGWTASQIELPDSGLSLQPIEIELLDQNQAPGWYWAAFLISGGLALLLAKRVSSWLLAAAGLLAAAALMAPDRYVAPASGALGGILAAVVVRVIRPRAQPASEDAASRGSTSAGASLSGLAGGCSERLLTMGVVWMAATLWMADALGADPNSAVSRPARSGPLYRVFIPIDDTQQPTGDPYQVPEPFYQYLRRRAQTATPAPSGWRLRQALYRAELTRNPTTGQWEIPRIQLTWECDLAGKIAQISLPLVRERFPIVAGSWLVEGQPIEPQWSEAGTMLGLPIPTSAPTVRIDGQVRPMVLEQAGWQGIEMAMPPTPQARFELAAPPDAPEVDLEGALGTVRRSDEPTRRFTAELGPTQRLWIRWPASASAPAEAAIPEVDQLVWLRVHPGAVLVEVRFRVSGGQGGMVPPVLRVMADNRLRLLGWEGGGNQQELNITSSAGGQIFEFPLLPASSDPAPTLALRLLLTDTTGLGNLRLPKLEPLQVRLGRRWLAVSVDASLEYPPPPTDRPQAVPIEEFLNLWGSADLPPQFVDNLAASPGPWSLVSRPRTPNSSVEQTLWLSYGEKMVWVWYEARLSTTSGSSFQHRLRIPSDLQVETITIWQDNAAVPIRWAGSGKGELNIFSYKPLTGRYEIRLTGSYPNVLFQRQPIPQVEIEAAETEWATLVLCRQPEVLLRLIKTDGLTEMESPPSMEGKPSLGRLFKAFVVDTRQMVEAELQVLPNRPQTACQQITLIRPEPDQWLAEVELDLQVQKGLVDEILFEVPPWWPGPYKTSPPLNLSIKELPEGRRAIVLRPPTSVEQTYRFRIAGPIYWPKTGPQELSAILPLQVPVTEHLVLLPIQDALRPLVWQIQGLEKVPLPEPLAKPLLGPGTWEAYRMRGSQFTARLQAGAEQTPQPEVRLADIHLRWETDRSCAGKAWFYLLPAGQDRCVVCLPAGFRLLQVQVDNNPSAPIIQGQPPRYTVLLGSSVLPQVVEVSFHGMLPAGVVDGLQPFPAPAIENWPVAVSLWTIYPPAGYELADPEGIGRVSELQMDTYRVRTIGTLLEIGSRQWGEPKEDFLRWYWVWRERFSAILRQVHRKLALPPATELHRTLRAEAQAFQLKLAQLAESLSISEPPSGEASARRVSADEAELWFEWLQGRGTVCRAVLPGPPQALLVTYWPKKASSHLWRWYLAAAIACAAVALGWLGAKLPRPWWLVQSPHLLGLLAGGIWWLWLWPSVLGWLFILLALLKAFRKGFPSGYLTPTHRRL